MLIKLPGGQWADPEAIRGIFAFPREDSGTPPRVVVALEDGSRSCEFRESLEDAEEARDDFAAEVNEMLESNEDEDDDKW